MTIDLDKLRESIRKGEIDFQCVNCEYNLRGLTGDSKTCPECGEIFNVDSFFSPEKISRKLRLMETSPTTFIASSFLLMLLAMYVWYYGFTFQSAYSPIVPIFSCVLLTLLLTLFFVSLTISLRYSRMASSGIRNFFQVTGFGFLVLVAGLSLIASGLWFASHMDSFFAGYTQEGSLAYIVPLIVYYAITIVVMTILYKLYRKFLDRLLWDVAIELLYERQRRSQT